MFIASEQQAHQSRRLTHFGRYGTTEVIAGQFEKSKTLEAKEVAGNGTRKLILVEHQRIELQANDATKQHQLTHDGLSNKESDWFRPQ